MHISEPLPCTGSYGLQLTNLSLCTKVPMQPCCLGKEKNKEERTFAASWLKVLCTITIFSISFLLFVAYEFYILFTNTNIR